MNESCPIPPSGGQDEAAVIRRLLAANRIAIVGLSDDPSRPSHEIAVYLQSQGKTVIPVNPTHETVLAQKCYPSLAAIPGPIDLVNVFRRPEHCAAVVRDAIEVGAKGVWLQSGIVNDEARELARDAGIDFVQDQCIMVQHLRQARGRG